MPKKGGKGRGRGRGRGGASAAGEKADSEEPPKVGKSTPNVPTQPNVPDISKLSLGPADPQTPPTVSRSQARPVVSQQTAVGQQPASVSPGEHAPRPQASQAVGHRPASACGARPEQSVEYPALQQAASQAVRQKPASTRPVQTGAVPKDQSLRQSVEHPPQQTTSARPEQKATPVAPAPVVSGGQQRASPMASRAPAPAVSGGRHHQMVPIPPRTQDLTLPKRNGYGNGGRPIELYSNHFKVKFANIIIFQYDMATLPEKLPKKKLRDLFEKMQQTNRQIFGPKCVFDGRKCVYSPVQLKFPGEKVVFNIEVQYEDNNTLQAQITLKQVATINMQELKQYLDGNLNFTPYVALQAMDIIMRYGPSMWCTPFGRSLFCEPRQSDNFALGGGLELHKGFYQSMKPSLWKEFKMSVNIDVSNTAFYKPGPVLDFMNEVLDIRRENTGRPLRDADRKKFEKVIKGLQIEVRRQPNYKRKFRVIGVTHKEAEKLTFPMTDEKGRTTDCIVAKYFNDRYEIRLQYSRLPCLHVGPPDKKTYIPIEMCYILPNQPCRRKLSAIQTSEMIKKTAIPAPNRLAEIQSWIKDANHSQDPNLKSFGIAINPNLVKIPGRVLAPPAIKYRQDKTEHPSEGSWSMRGKKFCTGISVDVWGIICFENERFCREDELEKMHSVLTTNSYKIGMPMQNASFVHYENPNDVDCVKMFEYYRNEYQGLQLLFIVLPGKGNDIYGDIKGAGDAQLGIATQNIQAKNAKKANPRTMDNICLKINAKLGGINNVINQMSPIMGQPVLILGADVTHPSPGDFQRPSIAAVVGSKDKHAFKYNAKVRVQTHRQEIIDDLEKMVIELLINFKESTGYQPKKIIMYRDGVSEGQFQQVLDSELMAIRRACSSLNKDYQPGITFLTVQKRHHTRLFCVNRQDERGNGRNVPAGTIVDKDITHPVNWDFFLCSHAGIQGTSRPAHYYVLWDDNNFTQNQLEEFTNQMCYTYARCTRSTSIPSPAYYAHHAAFRARDILYSDLKGSDSSESGSTTNGAGSEPPKLTDEKLKSMNNTVQVHLNQNGRMYYA